MCTYGYEKKKKLRGKIALKFCHACEFRVWDLLNEFVLFCMIYFCL